MPLLDIFLVVLKIEPRYPTHVKQMLKQKQKHWATINSHELFNVYSLEILMKPKNKKYPNKIKKRKYFYLPWYFKGSVLAITIHKLSYRIYNYQKL